MPMVFLTHYIWCDSSADEGVDKKGHSWYTYLFLLYIFNQHNELNFCDNYYHEASKLQLLSQQFGIHAAQMLYLNPSSISLNLAGTIRRELILPYLKFLHGWHFCKMWWHLDCYVTLWLSIFNLCVWIALRSPLNIENWEHTTIHSHVLINL